MKKSVAGKQIPTTEKYHNKGVTLNTAQRQKANAYDKRVKNADFPAFRRAQKDGTLMFTVPAQYRAPYKFSKKECATLSPPLRFDKMKICGLKIRA